MIDKEIGPYRVREQVPFRGPGRLFAGVHEVLGRKVHIRELPSDSFAGEEGMSRFLRGARIVQRHAPPELAVVHLSVHSPERVVLVTEFLRGTLEDRLLLGEGRLPLGRALSLCRTVLGGLRFLHENGIVHGNVCTDTVLFAEDGSAKVVEWGVEARGGESGVADDLLAAATLLQRLVEGCPERAGDEEPPPCGEESGVLAPLLERALHPDPARRFSSAAEFGAALEQVLQQLPEGAADGASEGDALLRFPGRTVPWGLLFGLMLVPLVIASLGRKNAPLPKVPHRPPPVVAGTESDPSPGRPPGMLPLRKATLRPEERGTDPRQRTPQKRGVPLVSP